MRRPRVEPGSAPRVLESVSRALLARCVRRTGRVLRRALPGQAGQAPRSSSPVKLRRHAMPEKIIVCLDWTPNTNHSGFFARCCGRPLRACWPRRRAAQRRCKPPAHSGEAGRGWPGAVAPSESAISFSTTDRDVPRLVAVAGIGGRLPAGLDGYSHRNTTPDHPRRTRTDRRETATTVRSQPALCIARLARGGARARKRGTGSQEGECDDGL